MDYFTPLPYKIDPNAPESYFYVKQHQARETDEKKPADRTLFVLNIPQCVDENSLKQVFSQCGRVENVFFHKKSTIDQSTDERPSFKFFSERGFRIGFNSAYVVFDKASSIQKALHLNSSKLISIFADGGNNISFVKWRLREKRSEQFIKDPKKDIDEYMAEYDRKVELEKEKSKEMDGVPDEEGWITVTKHGKNPVVPRTEETNQRLTEKQKKKRSEKALLNYYSFHVKQSKLEQLADLQRGFKAAKETASKLKQSRKFRPF